MFKARWTKSRNAKEEELSKKEYRESVTAACHKYDEKMLKEKTKCATIIEDDYARKDYFGKPIPGEVRDYFSTRVQMLPLAWNYSRDNRFRRTGWLCLCGQIEEQEHILRHCSKYDDIRVKYSDLSGDDSIVKFFREVLAKRDKVREEEEKEEKERRRRKGEGNEE